jgi:NTP pyrophosphatase (non-canonical NTP hydrolase)
MRGTDRERISTVTSPPLSELTDRLTAFRDARDWRQFHSLKNLILSVSLESAELLELTQWKDDNAVESDAKDPAFRRRLEDESADILLYLLLIAERAGFDLAAAAAAKIDTNEIKYSVNKSRGNARKYTEL